jgi:hypothetical protein
VIELALSKGPDRVGVFPYSLEDRNRSSFWNVVFSTFFWSTRWQSKKPSKSECCTPSSEPFRIYVLWWKGILWLNFLSCEHQLSSVFFVPYCKYLVPSHSVWLQYYSYPHIACLLCYIMHVIFGSAKVQSDFRNNHCAELFKISQTRIKVTEYIFGKLKEWNA